MQKDKFEQVGAQLTRLKISQMLSYCKIKPHSLESLPQSFLVFLKQRGVDKKQLLVPIPRYVRLKPHLHLSSEELAAKLKLSIEEIVQVQSHFWAVNPQAKINNCELYQQGLLYGMDYSSAVPAKCLQVQNQKNKEEKMQILQLCCAPGNKSMLMADLNPQANITGVQINQNRVNVMKSLLKKYELNQRISIVIADGLKFNSQIMFDRVLVDAQCTHQGSLKHIRKFFKESPEIDISKQSKRQQKHSKQQQKQFKTNNSNPYTSQINKANTWSQQDFQQRFLDHKKLTYLHQLQYGLLENGFRMLKEGGIIVYSTCSFDQQQNEDIVTKFLKEQSQAELVYAGVGLDIPIGWKYGTVKGTIRLSPSISYCGGMFIAKFTKKPTHS